MNNINDKTKNRFEKNVNKVWHQAADATLIMTLGSLGSFLIVFLIFFFLARDRISAFYVIPFALFASFIMMLVTQAVMRRIFQKKRNSTNA